MTGSVQNIGNVTLSANSAVLEPGNLETFLLAITADRANVMNSVAAGQAADMQKTNEKLAKLNAALNELRAQSPGSDTKDSGIGMNSGLNFRGLDQDTLQTLRDNGINYGDFAYGTGNYSSGGDGTDKLKSDGAWGRLMESVKTSIDSQSSSSQLDMIKLQSSVNKSNQLTEMLTNLVQKFSDNRGKIVGNFR
jgi:hypothetical protein